MENGKASLNGTGGANEKTPQKQAARFPDIFNGPITSVTIKMSIPMLISQVLSFMYIFVDTFFISLINRNSTVLITSSGLVFPVYMIVFTLARSLFLGSSSITARSIGRKNKDAIEKTGDSSLLLAAIAAVAFVVIGLIFGKNIIQLIAGSQLSTDTMQNAMKYFYFLLPGMALLMLHFTLGGIVQGEGLAKHVGWATTSSTIVNIVLNPVLIFGFKLGIIGSALATSISLTVPLIWYIVLFTRKKTLTPIKWQIFKADAGIVKEILRIGVPASIGMFLINIASVVINNLAGSISQDTMASWVLVSRIDQLFLIPGFTIGMTTIPMVGQNFGRKNFKRAKKIYRVHVIMCIVSGVVMAALYMLFAPQIFGIFSKIPVVVEQCVTQVRLLALTTIGLACITVTACSFQAMGKPMPNLINNVIRMLISIFPIVLPLVGIAVTTMYPVYLFVGCANIIACIVGLVWSEFIFKKMLTKMESANQAGTVSA